MPRRRPPLLRSGIATCLATLAFVHCAAAAPPGAAGDALLPLIPDDLEVAVFARDPLVRNPCALTFDAQGRLCVGMGPQYRNPTPQTPGDSVFILIDNDADGVADARKQFATGFNAIQGLAWLGGRLYVANAPDFTVVRDTDGDDVADEYIRLYTDLGNLEHGLHGLSWAPDGKLYLSKGNSKGLNLPPDRVAPQPFRELWGMSATPGTPDFPAPLTSGAADYQKNFHDPRDDWGLSGGVLRCDVDGSDLEIVARGFRNPWDLAFDDAFNWLGTDNDQTLGDKFFSPFFGANFGWGHPWSYDWQGDTHLPSAPSAGPLFEGSGTGVIYCAVSGYPARYRDVFFVNDWLRREVYIYRPRWDGARLLPAKEPLERLAHAGGGRAMDHSSGRSFDPVDIEIGPDGATYISSWGREYGTVVSDGAITNEGRIYKIWPQGFSLAKTDPKHARPLAAWTTQQLLADLGHHLPVWRSDAQQELLRRGKPVEIPATASRQLQTWALWTNGLIDPATIPAPDDHTLATNIRLQSLRLLGRSRAPLPQRLAPVVACLTDPDARIRHEAVLALHQAKAADAAAAIVTLAATEPDRVAFYSAWQALRALLPKDELRALLADDPRPGVRRAALLALLEDDALAPAQLETASGDADAIVADLASRRLGGKAAGVIRGASLAETPSPTTQTAAPDRPLEVVTDIQPRQDGRYEQAALRAGTAAYTDRPYRIADVPPALDGATFIRVANDHADQPAGTGFALDLRYPSTVFLADDLRGEILPAWARGKFAPTAMTLTAGDASYRVYQADFPAGQTSFGPNRDAVRARKAHYLIIVQPQVLTPQDAPATPAAVLPLIATADPEHGRNLFFQIGGATCSLCHRLEGRGQVFAPDLSDIGSRADAASIVRSILDPSAEITEGFAIQTVTRKDGTRLGGIVLGETARSLQLSPAAGQLVDIAKADISARESSRLSAMPAIFPTMLSANDVAAITAYLLQAKNPQQPPRTSTTPDRLSGSAFGTSAGFQITCTDDRLMIALRGAPLADYHYHHEQVWRPFFANLQSPSGTPVTRPFPPRDGDPSDHADMHPGLSLGFALLDGVNFWHNRDGRVVHAGFTDIHASDQAASFSATNRYLAADGREICTESATYTFLTNADGYLLTWDSRLSANAAITFGVKEEMGLAARVATPLTVKFGKGSILSAAGGINEEGTWGKVDSWWDYAGPVSDRHVGIQLMSAPTNPETWAHSRDYGVLVANPLPIDQPENRGKTIALPAGESLHLQFGIQVHDSPRREAYDPARAYQQFLQTLDP